MTVLAVLLAIGVPVVIPAAYFVIAVAGLVLLVRDLRAEVRREMRRDFSDAADRLVAQAAASQNAAKSLPWYQEVLAAQNAAIAQGASMFGLFSSFNPYWSLTMASLVGHGLTTAQELEAITTLARTAPPEEWQNGFMLSDLIKAGNTHEEALVRIGLYKANEHRFV